MSNLNLLNLKNNRNEVLKAEIVSLFTLLEKTFTEWWKAKGYFQGYSPVYNDISQEIENLLNQLKKINIDLKIKNSKKVILNAWDDFINKWREWRGIKLNINSDKFLQVLYGGCEGINSGIEKGSPKEQIKGDIPFLTNPYGTLKNLSNNSKLNKLREILFKENIINKVSDLKDILQINIEKIPQNLFKFNFQDLLNQLSDSPSFLKLITIRTRIYNLICLLYSHVPSDTRFPANDTSLFDQSYMSSSLFKSALSGIILKSQTVNNKLEIDISTFDQSTLKWSILGIQYDKLGLSEKGLKSASIKWYRETSNKVDNEIKKLLEIDYPIGNEVYRDETGIYFVVSENIIGWRESDFYTLPSNLSEIKQKIQEIFTNYFKGEVYPAIFLSEPSRGLMNLGHLIEKAKENFLKAETPDDFISNLQSQYDSKSEGICQLCKLRLANKQNKDDLICDVCKKRMEGRIDNWLQNPEDETIWTDELQDKNGRIALVTLKFELDKWINGDMVNSFLIRNEDFDNKKEIINHLIIFVKNQVIKNEVRELEVNDEIESKMNNFLDLFDKNGIKTPYKECYFNLKNNKSISNIDKGYKSIAERLLKNEKWLKHFSFFEERKIWTNRKKGKKSILDDYDIKTSKDHLFKIFIINFFIFQIYNLLLERSIGSEWEKFIKSNLGNKIDFQNRQINWQFLTDSDIQFLSELILQFLLRKNPSPARLKRIWETTREFFKDLESRVVELANITEERQKRFVWTDVKDKEGKDIEDGEYQDREILFWAKGGNAYLITSVGKIRDKKEFKLKKYREKTSDIIAILRKEDAKEHIYKPYFTILSPTPISWQFIIPAENAPELIKNIQKEYYKNFKWVYGKLPLHIGVIIQNYKKPLYIGIKALRKIRRDSSDWFDLRKEITTKEFKSRQKKAFHYQDPTEKVSDCENFYSLFEKIDGEGKYEFYLYPDKSKKQKIDTIKEQIDTTQNSIDTEKFYFYPNTFDFEFLDTNTRRNDIFYKKARRFMRLKQNRPYDIEDWHYFEEFEKYFRDKKTSSKLQKLISLIYSKLEDWNVLGNSDNTIQYQNFLISSFVNILELKDETKRNEFAKILGIDGFDKIKTINSDKFLEKILMLLDMFNFWHTALKFENKKGG